MIALPGLALRTKDFNATGAYDGKIVTVKMAGMAEMTMSKELETFMKVMHQAAVRYNTQPVIDLSDVDFMNSSCLKCFFTLVDIVRAAPEKEQYVVKLITNPKKHWQARSLSALCEFAGKTVSIETRA